jgi:hypothetical protein
LGRRIGAHHHVSRPPVPGLARALGIGRHTRLHPDSMRGTASMLADIRIDHEPPQKKMRTTQTTVHGIGPCHTRRPLDDTQGLQSWFLRSSITATNALQTEIAVGTHYLRMMRDMVSVPTRLRHIVITLSIMGIITSRKTERGKAKLVSTTQNQTMANTDGLQTARNRTLPCPRSATRFLATAGSKLLHRYHNNLSSKIAMCHRQYLAASKRPSRLLRP